MNKIYGLILSLFLISVSLYPMEQEERFETKRTTVSRDLPTTKKFAETLLKKYQLGTNVQLQHVNKIIDDINILLGDETLSSNDKQILTNLRDELEIIREPISIEFLEQSYES